MVQSSSSLRLRPAIAPLVLVIIASMVGTGSAADNFYSNWHSSLDTALSHAKQERRLVFVEFADTYVCPHCMRFRREVLSTSIFEDFAKDHLVLVLVDNPGKKDLSPAIQERNRNLWKEYRVHGTPTVVVLDPDANELFRNVGYGGAPAKEVVASLERVLTNEFSKAE